MKIDRLIGITMYLLNRNVVSAKELAEPYAEKSNNVSPEDFDKWRTRYCDELFADVIEHSKLGIGKTALEIGPGTGQATEPILKTGCSYLAIELGENFTEDMKNKFGSYDNFRIVNADFETYDFDKNKFDLVYSAATIQWIPEEIGFPKVYNIFPQLTIQEPNKSKFLEGIRDAILSFGNSITLLDDIVLYLVRRQ